MDKIIFFLILMLFCNNKEDNKNLQKQKEVFFSKIILTSTQKRPIEVYKVGTGAYKIAFIGVMHGDEPQGEIIIRSLLKTITENKNLINDKSLLLIPVLNPDGLKQRTRVNTNGVDLNRNFPTKNWKRSKLKNNYYSGKNSNSEAETKLIIELINSFKPNLIINIHSPYKVLNYDGNALKIAQLLKKFNGYKILKDMGYSTYGSLGTYFGKEQNIPVITLETSNSSGEFAWSENKKALIKLLETNIAIKE